MIDKMKMIDVMKTADMEMEMLEIERDLAKLDWLALLNLHGCATMQVCRKIWLLRHDDEDPHDKRDRDTPGRFMSGCRWPQKTPHFPWLEKTAIWYNGAGGG